MPRNAKGYNTHWTYDSNGNLLQATEQIGGGNDKVTTYVYNSFGERIRAIETGLNENNHITEYGYDSHGNLSEIKIKSNAGLDSDIVTSYENDILGRRTKKTDSLSRISTQNWNVMDKVTEIIFPPGL